MPFNV
jgi:hypothetical protein